MENTEPESVVPPTPKQSNGNIGATIGIIIIVILLALGGFYYFTSGIQELQQEQPSPEITGDEEDQLRTQGSSSDLGSIEADLNATDLSALDEASAGFETELNAQ